MEIENGWIEHGLGTGMSGMKYGNGTWGPVSVHRSMSMTILSGSRG